jgi:hypothetical protein
MGFSQKRPTLNMRFISSVCLLLIWQGLGWVQAGAQEPDSSAKQSDVSAELKALREAMSSTEKRIASQEQEIKTLKHYLKTLQSGADVTLGATQSATLSDGPQTDTYADRNTELKLPDEKTSRKAIQQGPPLSFKLGDAVITPGGFVDFENIFRSTNTHNNIATAFAAIPFSNTAQGHVTEFRTTAQYSRLSLKVTDSFSGNDVTGYVEGDFSGNDSPGVYQSVNGHTNRLRLYFMQLRHGNWEFVGGQTWSWLTPNRTGLGTMPSDLATTYHEDQNTGVGLPYTRAAELRVAYHPNEHWALGVGIENPNQFIGDFVALPTAYASTISSQFDNGNQIGAVNYFPDILSKVAYDTKIAGKHFHAEVTGLLTGAHLSDMPIGEKSFKSHSVTGGGGQIAMNYELLRNLSFLGNAFWSDGGAHYLLGTGPQLVIRPNSAGTDVSISMVHSGAGSAGFEWIASQKTAFAAYYGADYFQRNFFADTTNAQHPDSVIGYGGPGSPNTNNRAIQQASLDWLLTFWKHPKYGALQFYTQYSYLTRAPWFVSPGTPKNAHLSMVYAGFRYILPSTSGTLQSVPYPN